MPADRFRMANPQGRQKSCTECVRAKRRCDLRHPSCVRCSRQSLTCAYPPQPTARSAAPSSTSDSHSNNPSHGENAADNLDPSLLQVDESLLPPAPDTGLLDFDFYPGVHSIEALDGMLDDAPDNSHAMAVRLNSLSDKTFAPANLSYWARSRVEYSLEIAKRTPRMMVEELATPWCHPFLYEDHMPKSLQDAHAACALYMAKNKVNAFVTMRHISERASELVGASLPSNTLELLSRAHALLLYQIMLVFSSDLRYCSQIDMLIASMEDNAMALLPTANQDCDDTSPLPVYPTTVANTAWKAFVLRESCRRTVLATFCFVAICNVLYGRLGSCDKHLGKNNRVKLSAHLWDAKSAFDFAIAWNTKNHLMVKEQDYTEFLLSAQSEDVDTFGRMMMVGSMGIDDAKGWFYTKGGTF